MGKQAAAIGADLRKQIALAVKVFILDLDKRLRKATPVDTGHARANWVPSVGKPYESEAESSKVAGKVGSSAHAEGVSAVVNYKLEQGAVWESNNTPYIDRLNYGSSDQAPAGFIEQCVADAQAAVQAKLNVRIEIDPMSAGSKYGRGELARAMAENLAAAYSPFGDD